MVAGTRADRSQRRNNLYDGGRDEGDWIADMILWPAKTPSMLWAEAGAAEIIEATAAVIVISAKILNGLAERFIRGS